MRGRLFDFGAVLVVLGVLLGAFTWLDPVNCPAETRGSPPCGGYYVLWGSVSFGIMLAGISLLVADFASRRPSPYPAIH